MTREDERRLNALQEALEREEKKLVLDLFHLRRALDHLKRCRYEHNTGKVATPKEQKTA